MTPMITSEYENKSLYVTMVSPPFLLPEGARYPLRKEGATAYRYW